MRSSSAPEGAKVAAADFEAVVAADGKAVVGEFAMTLPEKAGVYVLRGVAWQARRWRLRLSR